MFMNQKSTNYLKVFAVYFLLPIALAKLLWSVGLFFLDKDALSVPKEESFIYHYNINLANNIIGSPKQTSHATQPTETHNRIDDIRLTGTFISGDSSFVVIEDNLGTTFLYVSEKYVGYTLIEVYDQRAVLEKNGKKYDLVLAEDKDSAKSSSSSSSSTESSKPEESVEFIPGEPVQLTHDELNSYVKNPNKIWKNIRIQELRKNGTIDGFRVNYVKKGSFFEKAGLKSGDVIKGIDGKEIKSLSDVMKYYSNVQTLDGLSLSIARGEEELDLEFNVN